MMDNMLATEAFRTEHALCAACARHIMRVMAGDEWSDLGEGRPTHYTNVCSAQRGGHVPAYGIVWH